MTLKLEDMKLGERIVFGRIMGNNLEMYIMNPDGSNLQRLTDDPTTERPVGWNLDSGQEITFTTYREGRFQVYVMDSNGKNIRRVTDDYSEPVKPEGKR